MNQQITETLKSFREGHIEDESFLRVVLQYRDWYVPVDEQNKPFLWQLGEQEFLAAQSIEKSPDASSTPMMRTSGRHLLRHLPSDCGGVVFDLATPHACVIERAEYGEVIKNWLNILEVEAALANPRPGQHELLVSHQWHMLADADGAPLIDEWQSYRCVHLFSAADTLKTFLARRPAYRGSTCLEKPGADLFASLAACSGYDAVALHYGDDQVELLGIHAVELLARGKEGRVSARILPARTTAEIELFLDLEDCSRPSRVRQDETLGNDHVVRYTGTVASRSRTWWFRPVEHGDGAVELGSGASSILCAGLLADRVRRRLRILLQQHAAKDAGNSTEIAETWRWARELEKMIVGNTVPRSAIQTPDGSRYLREFPEMSTAAWIRSAQEQLQT